MTNKFETFKNGKVRVTVWANQTTKEVVIANRNSFGYNYMKGIDAEFDKKYGCNLKSEQGKSNYRCFYNSAKSMQSVGFKLVKNGEMPLW